MHQQTTSLGCWWDECGCCCFSDDDSDEEAKSLPAELDGRVAGPFRALKPMGLAADEDDGPGPDPGAGDTSSLIKSPFWCKCCPWYCDWASANSTAPLKESRRECISHKLVCSHCHSAPGTNDLNSSAKLCAASTSAAERASTKSTFNGGYRDVTKNTAFKS